MTVSLIYMQSLHFEKEGNINQIHDITLTSPEPFNMIIACIDETSAQQLGQLLTSKYMLDYMQRKFALYEIYEVEKDEKEKKIIILKGDINAAFIALP